MSLDNGALGARGEQIAKKLWPKLELLPSGSREDRQGTDGWLEGERVQIKTDLRIVETRTVFWELGKKNGHWAKYGVPETQWRWSPCRADYYIFVTIGLAFRVKTETLMRLAIGRAFKDINGTAVGFLIPLAALRAIPEVEVVNHDEKLP